MNRANRSELPLTGMQRHEEVVSSRNRRPGRYIDAGERRHGSAEMRVPRAVPMRDRLVVPVLFAVLLAACTTAQRPATISVPPECAAKCSRAYDACVAGCSPNRLACFDECENARRQCNTDCSSQSARPPAAEVPAAKVPASNS